MGERSRRKHRREAFEYRRQREYIASLIRDLKRKFEVEHGRPPGPHDLLEIDHEGMPKAIALAPDQPQS